MVVTLAGLYCELSTYFTPIFSVSIVDSKQVNVFGFMRVFINGLPQFSLLDSRNSGNSRLKDGRNIL